MPKEKDAQKMCSLFFIGGLVTYRSPIPVFVTKERYLSLSHSIYVYMRERERRRDFPFLLKSLRLQLLLETYKSKFLRVIPANKFSSLLLVHAAIKFLPIGCRTNQNLQ